MISKDKLFWGKPCRRSGHQKADGTNLRHGIANTCMMCEKGPSLKITDQDELFTKLTSSHVAKRTEEEVKALRVAASMRWNARNKDKTKEYSARYAKKEERKKILQARYAAKSPEEKQALVDYNRDRRAKLREEKVEWDDLPERVKFTAEEKRERHNARMRLAYTALSDEEKARRAETVRLRKARKLEDKDGS